MILISEFIHPDGLKLLKAAGWRVHYDPELWNVSDGLQERLKSACALIVRNQTRVDARLLGSSESLRVVGRLGVGLDNIDVAAAGQRRVQVISARGANAIAVAEYVFAALLLFVRHLDGAAVHVNAGGWDRQKFGGSELWDKTLGLVGLGEVGWRVARRARVFGMNVLATDPARERGDAVVEEEGITLVSMDELLERSDFLSLHAPLTAATERLINSDTLGRLKAGSCIVNTARGGLVDSMALAVALRAGHLRAAVLDVVDQEPIPPEHPLSGAPNLWITPHVAGLTREAQERVTLRVVEGVLKALRNTAP